jgi:hypothetical protein
MALYSGYPLISDDVSATETFSAAPITSLFFPLNWNGEFNPYFSIFLFLYFYGE